MLKSALMSILAGAALALSSVPATSQTSIPKIHNFNGHSLLRQMAKDDIYAVGEVGHHMVIAKVQKGKVVAMEAADLPMRQIKLKTNAEEVLSDAFCFKDNAEFTCFWYTASDVTQDDLWVEYDPDSSTAELSPNSLGPLASVSD